MARRSFPSILEEMIKRMRREMRRGFPFSGEEKTEEFWSPFEDMISRMGEEAPEDFITEEETTEGKVRRYGPFVYGFSYSKKPGEEPEIQEFGNVKPGKGGGITPKEKGEREPLTEVVDLNGKYEVTVELPGAEKDEIDLTATEESLKIETTGGRKYKKEVYLEEEIEPDEIDANFNNGILTIEVEKKEEEGEEGQKIEIE